MQYTCVRRKIPSAKSKPRAKPMEMMTMVIVLSSPALAHGCGFHTPA
ncbi:MAG: hypothetical protein ABI340_03130 [Nitrososphaera sp.]